MRRLKLLWIVPAFIFYVLLVGMGPPPGQDVPKPEIDFKATVTDTQDIATKLHHASWNGNIFFTAVRGKGIVTISFEKIRKVAAVGAGGENKMDFQITLRSGEVVAVSLEEDSKLLGITTYGTFRIPAKNIKEITFD
ncbi:MAG: hypothetical protein HY887_10180 [Deltaproteobacteria bacterium]|nr:hypothetical protein [Deltaproteobacteria bacterium]